MEEIGEKDDIINELRNKVRSFDELKIQNDKNSQILADLYESGIIDADGQLILPQNRENNSH